MISKSDHLATRIRQSVRIDGNGCWIWIKSRSWNGYGRFALGGGRGARAHRVSYAAFNGPIPDGLDVCHKCDVRQCVNPDHLFVATRSENLMDASTKDRLSRTHQRKGSSHPSAKLSEDEVSEIIGLLKAGKPKLQISKQYGVSQRIILLIARGELWQHVSRSL